MPRKGLSIFQKLFIAFLGVGLISLTISIAVHYRSEKEFIEKTMTSQLSDSLHASIDYFHRTFTIPIKKDLGFIAKSPSLNNFLTSQKAEILLMKPPAERLFLYFTGLAESIYLSARFIDSKGKEKIITAGNRRVRDYAAIDHFPNNELYQRIYSLFERLKAENVGSILFEGPFKYKNNKFTFVVGISKMEPEIGGFGGAVIFHGDLTAYLNYLSDIKFHQVPIAFVFSPDNHVMLSPEKEASFDPVLYLSEEEKINNALVVSSSVKLGSNNDVLLNFALRIPPKIFSSELKKAFRNLAFVGVSIIILVGFIAFFMSMRLFAKPIKELSRGAERIGRGELDYRIKIETHDEIAQLADEFNRMTESLEKITVSRNVLIQEVDERKHAEEALRESEERFKLLADATIEGLAFHEKGLLLDANDRFVEMFGYDSLTEMLDMKINVTELASPKTREIVKKNAAEGYPDPYKAEGLRKGGSIFPVVIHGRQIPYEGRMVRIAAVRDVTEQKKAEQALRESEEKLTRAKKMEALGLLAGGVAHDLNNVLSGIVSYPELLLLDLPKDSKLRKPIETIQETGHRAAAIVQDLITVARGVAIAKEPLNLNAIVENYLLSPEFEKLEQFHSTVTIKTNLDTDLLNISGSDAHLRKVVMNLVSNASEAMEGSGNVIISTMNRYIDRSIRGYDDVNVGEYAVLSVSDGGPGISPDDLERIFEPFYTKKVMGRSGTGLGLAVVWNVVQDLKGYLNVISDENGTTFELYFPITRDEVSDKDLSIPIKDYKGDGETVLVVDDVESQREIACEMLETLGYKTKAVSSGEEAVEYLTEHTVDLILLDMIMDPGINGRETYERIIKIHPNQKAVIASGFAETDDVKEAQRLGAGQYIKKPLTLEKMGIAVRDELKK